MSVILFKTYRPDQHQACRQKYRLVQRISAIFPQRSMLKPCHPKKDQTDEQLQIAYSQNCPLRIKVSFCLC